MLTAPPLRILVADDCRDQTTSLCELLRLWGHKAVAAHDGVEALDRAAAGLFDVVVLDLAMPGVNGCEVARRLRAQAHTAGAFLVALTGYADAAHRERARQAGFDAYLVKPFDPDHLAELLDAVRAGAVAV